MSFQDTLDVVIPTSGCESDSEVVTARLALVAITVHIGASSNSGHFITILRVSDGSSPKCVLIDDASTLKDATPLKDVCAYFSTGDGSLLPPRWAAILSGRDGRRRSDMASVVTPSVLLYTVNRDTVLHGVRVQRTLLDWFQLQVPEHGRVQQRSIESTTPAVRVVVPVGQGMHADARANNLSYRFAPHLGAGTGTGCEHPLPSTMEDRAASTLRELTLPGLYDQLDVDSVSGDMSVDAVPRFLDSRPTMVLGTGRPFYKQSLDACLFLKGDINILCHVDDADVLFEAVAPAIFRAGKSVKVKRSDTARVMFESAASFGGFTEVEGCALAEAVRGVRLRHHFSFFKFGQKVIVLIAAALLSRGRMMSIESVLIVQQSVTSFKNTVLPFITGCTNVKMDLGYMLRKPLTKTIAAEDNVVTVTGFADSVLNGKGELVR